MRSAHLNRTTAMVTVLATLCATLSSHAATLRENCNLATAQQAVLSFDGDEKTIILSADWRNEGATDDGKAATPKNPLLPENCVVTGVIDPHLGDPNQTQYGNHFKLRIPVGWNERFLFQGGGGNNGTVGNSAGILKNGTTALDQGYAVVSQDSGHQGGAATFALDQKAYVDFGYQAVHDAAQISKAIIRSLAGSSPKNSYFLGCSNGGREAMVSAQRYDDFDGVVAGAPGFAVFDQWLANMWVLRVVADVAGVPAGTIPADTSRAYSDEQLDYAANYFQRKCDRLDGIEDGIVGNYQACQATAADLKALQCMADGGASGDSHCLSSIQTEGLKRIYTGPQDSKGAVIFPGYIPGNIETQLRIMYLGKPDSPTPVGSVVNSLMQNFFFMGYGSQGYPGVSGAASEVSSYPSGSAYVAKFDFDTEPQKLVGRQTLHGDNIDLRNAGPNFEAFRKRGGKLLMYVGSADPAVQAKGVMAFIDKLNARYTPAKAAKMARLFVVPGMAHCSGGNSTDQFDQLAPLVDWVEKGVTPERIIATALPGTAVAKAMSGVRRPLCVYPKFAQYKGQGDKTSADSFVCSGP